MAIDLNKPIKKGPSHNSPDVLSRQVNGVDLNKPVRKKSVEKHRVNPIDANLDGLFKGVTFNYSEEINAAIRAGARYVTEKLQGNNVDFTELFADRLQQEQDTRAAQEEAHPIASVSGEFAGGFTSGGSAVANSAKNAATLGGAYARGVLAGATTGAVAGSGDGDTLSDRAENAFMGAGIGVAIPGVGVPLAKGGYKLGEATVNTFAPGLRDTAKLASRKVIQAFERDGKPLGAIQRRIERSGGDLLPVDVGGNNTRSLAHAAATTPGGGGETVNTKLNLRQMGQNSRIEKALDPIAPEESFYQSLDDMIEARSKAADLHYEKHANLDEPLQAGENYSFNDLTNLIESRPVMAKALKNAQDYAREFQKDPFDTRLEFVMDGDEVVGVKALDAITTRTVDKMKKAFDRMYKQNRASDPGRAAAILQQKHDLLAIVDDINPAYKTARSHYADSSQAIEAMENGKKFFKGSANEKVHEFGKLSDDERFFYRKGAIEGVREMLDGTVDGADSVRKLIGKESSRKRFAALFDNPKDHMKFMKTMLAEVRKSKTRKSITGGSPTDPRQAARADKDASMADLVDVVASPVGAASRGLTQRAMDRVGGLNSRTSAEISRILFTRDPQQLQMLQGLAEKDQQISDAVRAWYISTSGGFGAVAGGQQ